MIQTWFWRIRNWQNLRRVIKYTGRVLLAEMEEKQEAVVVAINKSMNRFWLILLCFPMLGMAQQENVNSYKKRVLETTEVDILSSYYEQTGNNASVTGGIGNERLTDVAGNVIEEILA